MVNVAGRSKGCNTCRKRKKGCDQGKPNCARCVHDNLHCEGYERQTIFVTHTPQAGAAGLTRITAVRPKVHQRSVRISQALEGQSSIVLRDDLANTAFRDQAFARFLDTYLPKGSFVPPVGTLSLVSYAWAETIVGMSFDSATLRLALSAVSFSLIGNREKDIISIRHGAECYGAAIIRLNQQLRDSSALKDDAVIPACMLLSAYEEINGFGSKKRDTRDKHWQAHAAGMAKLLQLRGPMRHSSGAGQFLFIQGRFAQFTYFFTIRKACPFADSAWTTIPWTNKKKTVRDKLLDVIIQVPALLERSDLAIQRDDKKSLVSLIQDILEVFKDLQQWRSHAVTAVWMMNYGKTPVNWAIAEAPDYLMSHGMDVAHGAIMYWAVCTSVCATLRVLSQTVDEQHQVDTYLGDDSDPQTYAMYVVRCMHHFLQRDAGLVGFQNVSFAIGVVLQYFTAFRPKDPLEREFVRAQLSGAMAIQPYGPMVGALLQHLQKEEDCHETATE